MASVSIDPLPIALIVPLTACERHAWSDPSSCAAGSAFLIPFENPATGAEVIMGVQHKDAYRLID